MNGSDHIRGPIREPWFARELLPLIVSALARTPFEPPWMWSQAVVVLSKDERRATSRADFSHYLRANGLDALAHECGARKIAPGCLLLFIDAGEDDGTVTRFAVLDVVSAYSSKTSMNAEPKNMPTPPLGENGLECGDAKPPSEKDKL